MGDILGAAGEAAIVLFGGAWIAHVARGLHGDVLVLRTTERGAEKAAIYAVWGVAAFLGVYVLRIVVGYLAVLARAA